jgi:hypothetical protein
MTRTQWLVQTAVMALFSILGGAAAVWLMPGSHPVQAQSGPLVTVSELRLVDPSGHARVVLSLLRGQPRLIMLDNDGEFRMELGLGDQGEPLIWMRDANGKTRASLGLAPGGRPALILKDKTGRDRLAVWQEEGETGLALADSAGRPRAGLALKKEDTPRLDLYGPDGKALFSAPSQ